MNTTTKKRKVSPGANNHTARKRKELPVTSRVGISQTGIRSGEFIIGNGAATGTVLEMIFRGAEYPPSRDMVALLTDTQVRDLLNNFEYFASMTELERREYLNAHAVEPKTKDYISDIENVFVIIHSIGGLGFIDPTDPTRYDDLMGHEIPLLELFARIPGGEKTRNKSTNVVIGSRHSLIFRPSLWSLKPSINVAVPELFISLMDGRHHSTTLPGQKFKCELSDKDSKTFVVEMIDTGSTQFRMNDYGALFVFAPQLREFEQHFNRIQRELEWFTPSVHKSLLQKLVRTRCVNVRLFNGDTVPADAVFIMSFLMLLVHPGAFVPDIQRFVSGAESAFKRVGVAMGEDTHCPIECISSALSSALCAQRHTGFKPSVELVANILTSSLAARNSPWKFKYNMSFSDRPIQGGFRWKLPYVLLNTLGSFKSDVALMQWIGINQGAKQNETEMDGLSTMCVEYCIDQHSLTNIAWLMPVANDRDYECVFQRFWKTGTGRNSRETEMETTPVDIALAQKLMWTAKSTKQKKIWEQHPTREKTIQYSLSHSWMAGIMEKIELRINGTNVVVFAHPDVRGKFICMRPATRDKASEDLSEEMQDEATAQVIQLLSTTGKQVKSDFLGVSGKLTYDAEKNEFLLNGERWDGIREGTKTVKIARSAIDEFRAPLTDEYFAACFQRSVFLVAKEGQVTYNADTQIKTLLQSIEPECIARLAMYVRPIRKHIELYRVSRDGSSTYLQVSCKDTVVFRILVVMTCIIPGVLAMDSGSQKFVVQDFKSWSPVRALILEMMSNALRPPTRGASPWADVVFTETRKLYTHQASAVDVLKDRIEKKQRGNLIWIPVGLGKTLIVNTFIGWLISQNVMPEYCVYGLPPSAFESIQAELRMSGLPFAVVEKSGDAFQTGKVNLIKHDRMRAFASQLTALAPNCFFVLDEFHLTMNATQRTSIALEMAKLAWNFVGMTGTLVKDKGSKGIIDWVSQVVEFEVTERNYWVAVAALVSRKIPLKIVEERIQVAVEMTPGEKEIYYLHVDARFGGKAMRTNFRAATDVCFGVIERGLIEETLRYARRDQTTPPVFVVARNTETQQRLAQYLSAAPHSLRVFLIDSKHSIRYAYADAKTWDVVITTTTHSTGYTLTKCNVMISAVYFSNQATRDQLDGRLMRLDQKSPVVRLILLHTGLLSYTLNHHEDARALRKAMEDLATDIRY